jgi:glycosyltransferase involved in cell wall biosynthesis
MMYTTQRPLEALRTDASLSVVSTRLLVVIPCLNEAATIGDVVSRIPRSIPGITEVDVLVVDDGSIDGTASIAADAGAAVLSHGANRGVGVAFQNALEYAVQYGYAMLVNIDGDGQFNPEDIPKLVEPLLLGTADMATASRFKDAAMTPEMPRVKLVGNHMMSWLISRLVHVRYYDVSCGFRCYSRDAMLRLNLHGAFTYTQETFLDFAVKSLRIQEVPIQVRYFRDRKSRVAGSILKYASNTAKIIFRSYRDYYPLRFFFSLALVIAIPALIFGGIFLGHFLLTGKFTGYLYAGFSSAFLILLSLVFIILGIVTDMLDRIRVNQERVLYMLKRNSHS